MSIPQPIKVHTGELYARKYKCMIYDDSSNFPSHVMISFKPGDDKTFIGHQQFNFELKTFGNVSDHNRETFNNANIIKLNDDVNDNSHIVLEELAKNVITHAHDIIMKQKQTIREKRPKNTHRKRR